MVVRVARFVLFTVGALSGFRVSGFVDWSEQIGFPQYSVIIVFVILGGSIGYLIGGIAGRELVHGFDVAGERVRDFAFSDMVLGVVGLFAGLFFALLVSSPLRIIEPTWVAFLAVSILYFVSGYGGASLALSKRREFEEVFRRQTGAADGLSSVSMYLDTSAVIDGRFIELREQSLLQGRLLVPNFVLAELQTLADSADDGKRARGRRGLDLLDTLRTGPSAVESYSVDYPDLHDVDTKLMRLAIDAGGVLVTVDYNLTKVARVQGISVVNLNEVALALRPVVQAGDVFVSRMIKKGKEPGQGVGYMEDGTMIVVEGAEGLVGEDTEILVTSIFQSSAGRMIFARLRGE